MKRSLSISLLLLAAWLLNATFAQAQWSNISIFSSAKHNSVAMKNADVIVIASDNNNYGETVATTNGGTQWTPFLQTFQGFTDVAFGPDSAFFVAGLNSAVFSTNGGNGFLPAFVPYGELVAVSFVDEQHGFTAHHSISWDNKGGYCRTSDGGATWDTIPETSFGDSPMDIHFFNSTTGVAVGQNHPWFPTAGFTGRTTDGGNTWTKTYYDYNRMFHALEFADANTGYACSFSHIYKTTDGGITWNSTGADTTLYSYNDLAFVNASTGFVVCSDGNIFKTTDGGNSWVNDNSGNTRALYGIDCADGTCFAVGDTGTILKLTGIPNSVMPQRENTIEMQVWPNPASTGMVNVKWNAAPNDPVKVTLLTAEGKQIKMTEAVASSGQEEINISELAAGLYLLRLESTQGIATRKLIVE